MADQPSNVHLQLAGTDRLMTADGFGKQHIFGADRAVYPVSATLTGPGTAAGIVPPAGIRLVVVAIGVDWAAAPAAALALHVDVKLGGNGPLGTTDAAAFSGLHPAIRIPAGAAPGTIFLSPIGVVTIAGDGSTSTMRFRMSVGGGADVATVSAYVYGENAEDLPCPT